MNQNEREIVERDEPTDDELYGAQIEPEPASADEVSEAEDETDWDGDEGDDTDWDDEDNDWGDLVDDED